MSEAIIRCDKLRKRYGSHDVLHSVDFEIQKGQLVGFLGPNGAGKTTTIRLMLGLLQPTSGESLLFGQNSKRYGKSIRREVGFLPGDVHMYSNLTGRKMLNFMASARRLNCDAEIDRLADVFELDISRTIRKYSTGMRQKLGLIQALMHKPRLLVLDEPTSALDPLVRQGVFAELKSVVADGRTVLLSSHSLSEVEEICDEVIILRAGKIVEQQRIGKLQDRAVRRVEIMFCNATDIPDPLPSQLRINAREGRTVKGTWAGKTTDAISWLSKLKIDDVIIEKPDLNDLFLTYYQNPQNPTAQKPANASQVETLEDSQ